jgi:hypothetical protein
MANKVIRPLAFVKIDINSMPKTIYDDYYKETLGESLYIFLGEVPNCKGHCILADLSTGKFIGMYHTDNFREATEDEV